MRTFGNKLDCFVKSAQENVKKGDTSVGSGLAQKYQTRLMASSKHSNLLLKDVIYNGKSFLKICIHETT